MYVALFTRAWIEMPKDNLAMGRSYVALFTRAWIEISRAVLSMTA